MLTIFLNVQREAQRARLNRKNPADQAARKAKSLCEAAWLHSTHDKISWLWPYLQLGVEKANSGNLCSLTSNEPLTLGKTDRKGEGENWNKPL